MLRLCLCLCVCLSVGRSVDGRTDDEEEVIPGVVRHMTVHWTRSNGYSLVCECMSVCACVCVYVVCLLVGRWRK